MWPTFRTLLECRHFFGRQRAAERRKIGQALGSSIVGYALAIIGFQSGVKEQTQEVLNGIYNLATAVPATLFCLVVLMFMLVYPLSKKKVNENAEILRLKREAKNN